MDVNALLGIQSGGPPLVVSLEAANIPYDEFIKFKRHPFVAGIIKDGKVLKAIEIETGKSDVQANIDKYAERS